jgi:hypothetical protein
MTELIFSLFLLSVPAYAMHNYADDDCVATSASGKQIEIGLANDVPAAPHRLPSLDGNSDDIPFVNMDQSKDSNDEPAATSALVLKVLSNKKTSEKKISDGCFEGKDWTSVRVMTVIAMTDAVKNAYGLKIGEKLTFKCASEFQAPTGPDCRR